MNGKGALGWRITRNGDYSIDLPPLSDSEEALVLAVEERLRAAAREKAAEPANADKEIALHVSSYAAQEGIALDSAQKGYLAKYAKMHAYGFAFLDELVGNDSIEEISVVGIGKPAYVFMRKGGWLSVNAEFTDEKMLMDVINKMASCIGRRITLQHPRLDAMLPDGSRLHASLRPVSQGEITIRKFRQAPFSPREIVDSGAMDAKAMAFLSMLMQTDSSVLVAGNTASGKTTTLNALFSFVPAGERILITEETPEINVPHAHQARLVANRDMGISLKDLVYDSLRMRPDRMIVGEVRNREEVEALFDVLLGGQARGAYATFHAQGAEEALLRLRKFGVEEMDLGSMDAIIVQRRMLAYDPRKKTAVEKRRVVEIAEVDRGMARGIFTSSGGKLAYRAGSALEKKIAGDFGLGKKEFAAILSGREKWLAKAPSGFSEFFGAAQAMLYKA